jgi:hypothetical protein
MLEAKESFGRRYGPGSDNTRRGITLRFLDFIDFERLKTTPQGSLHLMGIDTHNVLGTEHKNAANMRLSIDVMEVLYTRPEISTFVLLAGDRDYIPVIQHLRRQARSVPVAAFRGSSSGDLLLNVGEKNFIEAMDLIDPRMIQRLEFATRKQAEVEDAIRERAMQEKERIAQEEARAGREVSRVPLQRDRGEPAHLPEGHARELRAVRRDLPEPFLRVLSDALPRLADYERKALLNDLEAAGALRIEKRKGEPFDYSVLVVNYNHPTVRELNPG